jgi:hemoglobin
MSRPSLFEFAGGEPAFLALARAHHERCLADPVLNHPFSHTANPEHVERLAAYWAEVLGGPPTYSETCSDQLAMIVLHAHTGADAEFGPRFVDCFVGAMDEVGLPDDPEFRAVMRAYMEWATRDVMAYAPFGAAVPDDLVVPRWSWDGLERGPESG